MVRIIGEFYTNDNDWQSGRRRAEALRYLLSLRRFPDTAGLQACATACSLPPFVYFSGSSSSLCLFATRRNGNVAPLSGTSLNIL